MKKGSVLAMILLVASTLTAAPARLSKAPLYGLWLHPPDAGHNEAEVAAFMEKAHEAHINTIVMLVKGGSWLYYRSKLFPEAVAPDYRNFDLLRAVITEAHKRGMKVHAWLTDFLENPDGYAYTHHPEWAAINPAGKTTHSERSHGKPYPYVWMCPARRPGYTDQYLLPIIREIVSHYDVDGIHHDYVRYVGDGNPDGYCFCDYCLAHIFTHSGLKPPRDWDQWTREQKASFLFSGPYHYDYSTARDRSLLYFFYTYRTDAIEQFVGAAYKMVKGIRPQAVISAAVFRNPMTSGRFIGQRWTDWTRYVDKFMPMSYRSSFKGDWPTFLKEFAECTRRQRQWVGGSEFDQGIASTYLYREMRDPLQRMNEAIDEWTARKGAGGGERAEILKEAKTTLAQLPAGARKQEFAAALQALPRSMESEADTKSVARLEEIDNQLLTHPPRGFYPPGRLLAAIRIAHQNGAEGIMFYSGGSIEREHLWGAVKEGYSIVNQAARHGSVAALR